MKSSHKHLQVYEISIFENFRSFGASILFLPQNILLSFIPSIKKNNIHSHACQTAMLNKDIIFLLHKTRYLLAAKMV